MKIAQASTSRRRRMFYPVRVVHVAKTQDSIVTHLFDSRMFSFVQVATRLMSQTLDADVFPHQTVPILFGDVWDVDIGWDATRLFAEPPSC